MIFDTHAHYDSKQFESGREALLASLPDYNIKKVVNVGASLASTRSSIQLAEQYDFIYASVGVHPSDVTELEENQLTWLKEQTLHAKVVAVGEIGLDYYWEKEAEMQKKQRYWFLRQLELAKEVGLPVIIHSREAAEDTLSILKEADTPDLKAVIHCYSYSKELAKEFVKMGYYIGVGGVVTFKNAKKLKETVEQIPLERILLETDCPYMAPEPYRGKRNDSRYIPHIVTKIAEIKQVTEEEVEAVTWQNAMDFYDRAKEN